MINTVNHKNYTSILKSELLKALGCTEPIAIAYAAAKAKAFLGKQPDRMEVTCSGNIIKNVKGVVVPNTGGLIGIAAAAIAGIVGGDAEKELEVLESVSTEDHGKIRQLLDDDMCTVIHFMGVENLYIIAKVFFENDFAEVHIKNFHTNIIKVIKNGITIFENEESELKNLNFTGDSSLLTIKEIIEFAETVNLDELRDILSEQIKLNTAISEEGLRHNYGANVGKTLLKYYGNDVKNRAKAKAAAGSDARMSGCSLPVIINSGSGNQGITVTAPVVEFARELKVSEEKLYKALIISNLTSIHQKSRIGKLSAYCGAVSAAAGSAAGITYLHGGDYEAISKTITNTIANVGGILCDGAKSSCAAKIASAVDAGIMAHYMSAQGDVFKDGEGLVKSGIEETIGSIGRVGKLGMAHTDIEIIDIMLSN